MAASANKVGQEAIYLRGATSVELIGGNKSVRITTNGRGARISISLPEETLEEVVALAIDKVKISKQKVNKARKRLGI